MDCLCDELHIVTERKAMACLSARRLVNKNGGISTAHLGVISSARHVTPGVIRQLLGSVDELDGVTTPVMRQLCLVSEKHEGEFKTYQHSWAYSTPANLRPRALQKDWHA
jgi:hypothetical protein